MPKIKDEVRTIDELCVVKQKPAIEERFVQRLAEAFFACRIASFGASIEGLSDQNAIVREEFLERVRALDEVLCRARLRIVEAEVVND